MKSPFVGHSCPWTIIPDSERWRRRWSWSKCSLIWKYCQLPGEICTPKYIMSYYSCLPNCIVCPSRHDSHRALMISYKKGIVVWLGILDHRREEQLEELIVTMMHFQSYFNYHLVFTFSKQIYFFILKSQGKKLL